MLQIMQPVPHTLCHLIYLAHLWLQCRWGEWLGASSGSPAPHTDSTHLTHRWHNFPHSALSLLQYQDGIHLHLRTAQTFRGDRVCVGEIWQATINKGRSELVNAMGSCSLYIQFWNVFCTPLRVPRIIAPLKPISPPYTPGSPPNELPVPSSLSGVLVLGGPTQRQFHWWMFNKYVLNE